MTSAFKNNLLWCFARKFILVIAFFALGCAYRWGHTDYRLAGGYEQLAIPVFKNQSREPGVEIYFTNSLVRQFERSKIASVVSESLAPLSLQGVVIGVDYIGESLIESDANSNSLPTGTVLNTQYRVYVTTRLRLVRNSDQKVVWEGEFKNERVYVAPRMESAVTNTADPLYNQSARHLTISKLADDMMLEAHDRMTENF